MKFKFGKILLIGVVIRLVLMPITIHPDIFGHSFTAYFFSSRGIINIYEHLLSLPAEHPLVTNFGVADIFIYPPLTYFTLGIFRVLVSPLVDPSFVPWLMENVSSITTFPNYWFYIFLFKLPYLLIDVVTAVLLSRLFDDENKQKLAFILWMFNPLAIYVSFMLGQLDLLPTLFMVLTMFLAKKKLRYSAMICLGIGGGYKMFPLLLILPMAFYFSEKFWTRVKYIVVGFTPFVLTVIPFINSSAFRGMVFSPKSQKMLYMGWNITGAQVIYPFIFGLFLIYLFSYYKGKKYRFEYYFYAILLLVFSVTHYHPQWFLWLTPLIIWEAVYSKFRYGLIYVIFVGAWLFLTLMFEPSLSYGMFYPVFPGVVEWRGLAEILVRYTDVNQLSSIVRSIFAASALFVVVSMFVNKEASK